MESPGLSAGSKGGDCDTELSRPGPGQRGTQSCQPGSSGTNQVIREVFRQNGQTGSEMLKDGNPPYGVKKNLKTKNIGKSLVWKKIGGQSN